jgi:hypothetical protein
MGFSLHQGGGFAAFTSVLLYTCGLWQLLRAGITSGACGSTLHQVAASPPSGDSALWQMHRDGIVSGAWEFPCIRGAASPPSPRSCFTPVGCDRCTEMGDLMCMDFSPDQVGAFAAFVRSRGKLQSEGPAVDLLVKIGVGSRFAAEPAPCSRSGATAWPRRSRCCASSPTTSWG